MSVLADQKKLAQNSSARTQDTVWKTCREQWMIETDGERERERERVKEIRVCGETWWWWWYIYIYIVIHRQTVSFYQNSSVWLDTQDARSRDRNPSNFTLDCVSDHSSTKRTTLAKGIFIFRNSSSSLCLHFFIPSRLPECSILSKSFALYIYIYIYIHVFFQLVVCCNKLETYVCKNKINKFINSKKYKSLRGPTFT